MSPLPRAAAAAVLCCFANSAAAAIDEDLARCAAIGAADARLACFDALAARRGAPPPTQPSVTPPAPVAAVEAPIAPPAGPPPPPPRATAPAPTAPASTTATTATPVPAATGSAAPADQFGFSAAQLHTAPAGPEAIEAAVTRVAENRIGQTTITLDNGQTWLTKEADVRLSAGDRITIKRAALGSYLLLAPSRRSYRVNRLQ